MEGSAKLRRDGVGGGRGGHYNLYFKASVPMQWKDTTPYCDFSRFFLYFINLAGCISKALGETAGNVIF
jgi:hypothetical protein